MPYENYNKVLQELAVDKDFVSLSYTYFDLILNDYKDEAELSGYVQKL